jgi:hypothetical protein
MLPFSAREIQRKFLDTKVFRHGADHTPDAWQVSSQIG